MSDFVAMGEIVEEWRDIPGFEGRYEVSDLGRIRNAKTGHIKQQNVTQFGYYRVALYVPKSEEKRGKSVPVLMHRAVAKAFLPNPNNWPDVNHKDLDKSNNTLANLEWSNDFLNQQHASANKLYFSHCGTMCAWRTTHLSQNATL